MTEMNDLRMNLKVCEGCGALWLRRLTVKGVYCRHCLRRLADFPAPRGKHAGGRKPKLARITHSTHTAGLAAAQHATRHATTNLATAELAGGLR